MRLRICKWCGEAFTQHEKGRTKSYCSDECAKMAKKEKDKESYNERKRNRKSKRDFKSEPKRGDSFTQRTIEAKEKGISYGKLMALKYMEDMK